MLPWKLRKCQILPVNQNLSSVYFSYAKFQLVSWDPSLAIIWQITYTHKLPKLCSATLSCLLKRQAEIQSAFGSLYIHYLILFFSSQKTLAYVYTHGMSQLPHDLK